MKNTMALSGKKMELLAPAGNLEVLKAVVDAGCDSVYIGGKLFGMRQHAHWLNFTKEEMAEGLGYAHTKGVKLYVTVNNLLSDAEIEDVREYLLFLGKLAPDAIIVQDLGVVSLAGQLGLHIPLHASTMMNVHNAHAATLLKRAGFKRIVCSRDISIHEAAHIKKDAGVEVEYFLHNDICISQGAICYLSGIATEKSSNRGLCIKPCRWAYDFINADTGKGFENLSGKYFLAKKDICLFHQTPELITEEIDSVKIEGRPKPAAYLVPIVSAYRRAIDHYYEDPYGYCTDFKDFEKMVQDRIRNYTTNHAFKDPGVSGCDHSGKREPRFFSLAAEEKGMDDSMKQVFLRHGFEKKQEKTPLLTVTCSSCLAAQKAIESGADLVYVGGEFFDKSHPGPWTKTGLERLSRFARDAGKEVAVASPRILMPRELFEFKRMLTLAKDLEIETVLAANLGALEFVRRHAPKGGFQIVADLSFNIFNSRALKFLKNNGVHRAALSPEITYSQVVKILGRAALPIEALVHGTLCGMLLESCLISGLLGNTTKSEPCKGYCAKDHFAIRDRLGKDRMIMPDQYCRNHLLMEKDVCLLDVLHCLKGAGASALRIEGRFYSPETLAEIVRLYKKYMELSWCGSIESTFEIEPEDWRRLIKISPRDLGYGAYVNETIEFAKPGQSLPTDEIILYKKNSGNKKPEVFQ